MAYSRTGAEPLLSQHRRRASRGFHVPPEALTNHDPAITTHMSLDRSPSRERGGWSSPGLSTPYENEAQYNGDLNGGNGSGHSVTWAKARAKSARVQSQEQHPGFIAKHYRRLSESLPYFAHGGQEDRFAEKEKLGRGRANGGMGWSEVPRRMALLASRRRKYLALMLLVLFAVLVWFNERRCATEFPEREEKLTRAQHYCTGTGGRRS